MDANDIQFEKSANHPATDSALAGGASSGIQVTNASRGEILPRLTAAQVGDLDDDAETQYQEGYYVNTHGTDTLDSFGFYISNLLKVPASPGQMKAQSTSSSDNSSKTINFYIDVAGVLVPDEQLALAGTSLATAAQTAIRCFRARLQSTTTGALVAAAGRIDIYCGAELIGCIPAGESFAIGGIKCAAAASNGDTGTFTNRRTQPGGLTWSVPNTEATRIPGTATLGPGQKRAVYFWEELQPGMEAEPDLKLCQEWAGEDIGEV